MKGEFRTDNKTVLGYKAFNKGLKCLKKQYKEGKTHITKGKLSMCSNGMHFCENPLDVLDYYDLCESEFASVEAIGEVKKEGNKTVTNKLKITAKIDLRCFINASFNFLWKKGKQGDNIDDGNYSQLASSGDYSKLASSGDYSIVAGIGYNNIAKAKIGSWIVLAEWVNNKPINVISVNVDGLIIKEDIFYRLVDGKFVEA